MGYTAHHAIVVTGWDVAMAEKGRQMAVDCGLGDLTSPVVVSRVNACASFFVAPDGSKEGWTTSDAGKAQRAAFIERLTGVRGEDRIWLDWALVRFGGDEPELASVESRNGPWQDED